MVHIFFASSCFHNPPWTKEQEVSLGIVLSNALPASSSARSILGVLQTKRSLGYVQGY
jgi:hypothetical protein